MGGRGEDDSHLKLLLLPYLTYYRFQINCSFLPKSEIFYTPDVKYLGTR